MRPMISRYALAALGVLTIAPLQNAQALGPELAPNPGFEQAVTDPTGDTTKQPLLPTGWIFEGAAGLFDHSQNDRHTGLRMAAISIPASTSRVICAQGCVENPLNPVKDATAKYYSVQPFWRTLDPVTVTAGTTYRFQVWTSQELASPPHGGAITKVRWLDAGGMPISESAGPRRLQGTNTAPGLPWELVTRNVVAPSGATGAILLLGAADDLFASQIRYDDVSFRVA